MRVRLDMLLCCVVFGLQCAALCPADAVAQTPPAAPGTSDHAAFAVRIIEATKAATPSVDPRLADMARELQAFQKFNRFAIVREQTLQLSVGARGTVRLPDGADFTIQLLGFTPGKVQRARHLVEMPNMKMTRVVAPGGRTLDVVPGTDKLTIISTTVGKGAPGPAPRAGQ